MSKMSIKRTYRSWGKERETARGHRMQQLIFHSSPNSKYLTTPATYTTLKVVETYKQILLEFFVNSDSRKGCYRLMFVWWYSSLTSDRWKDVCCLSFDKNCMRHILHTECRDRVPAEELLCDFIFLVYWDTLTSEVSIGRTMLRDLDLA